jgi:hypothetical protein
MPAIGTKECLYLCQIEQSGKLATVDVRQRVTDVINLLRAAYIGTGTHSHLKACQKVDKKILQVAKF